MVNDRRSVCVYFSWLLFINITLLQHGTKSENSCVMWAVFLVLVWRLRVVEEISRFPHQLERDLPPPPITLHIQTQFHIKYNLARKFKLLKFCLHSMLWHTLLYLNCNGSSLRVQNEYCLYFFSFIYDSAIQYCTLIGISPLSAISYPPYSSKVWSSS